MFIFLDKSNLNTLLHFTYKILITKEITDPIENDYPKLEMDILNYRTV